MDMQLVISQCPKNDQSVRDSNQLVKAKKQEA
jgi:hypothetical protein